MPAHRSADVARCRNYPARVFCPTCGDVLVERNGWTTCPTGEDGFSQRMDEMLADYCQREPSPEVERETTIKWGGMWYCPLDGVKMMTSDNLMPGRDSIACEVPAGTNAMVVLDWKNGRIVGLEVMDASHHLHPDLLQSATPKG